MKQSFRYEALDASMKVTGFIKVIDASVDSDGGSMTAVDFTLPKFVRIWCMQDGIEYPMLTAVPRITGEKNGIVKTASVDLYTRLDTLTNDNFGYSYVVPRATDVIPILRSFGLIIDGSKTLAEDMVFELDANKLDIVNAVLAAINYNPVWTDGMGNFRSEPYVLPSQRPVKKLDLYLPEYTRVYDTYGIPNKVIAIGKTVNIEAPTATAGTGTPVKLIEVDYTDLTNLQDQANRLLVEAQTVVETFNVDHTFINTKPGDIVEFLNGKAEVVKWSMSCKVGSLVNSELRRI